MSSDIKHDWAVLMKEQEAYVRKLCSIREGIPPPRKERRIHNGNQDVLFTIPVGVEDLHVSITGYEPVVIRKIRKPLYNPLLLLCEGD